MVTGTFGEKIHLRHQGSHEHRLPIIGSDQLLNVDPQGDARDRLTGQGNRRGGEHVGEHLIHAALVRVVTLEAFIRLANNAQL